MRRAAGRRAAAAAHRRLAARCTAVGARALRRAAPGETTKAAIVDVVEERRGRE